MALKAIYDYFGAHKAVDRVKHEKQRAIQRFLFPWLIPFGIFLAQGLYLTDKGYFGAFTILPVLYGVFGGLGYYFYISRNPSGGVGLQYLFLICDPLATEAAIAYEPRAFSWMGVILLIIIARAGVRYGTRTLLLTWCSAIIGAVVFYMATLESLALQENKHTYLVVLAALLGVLLFIPLIRSLEDAHLLELERAKLDAQAELERAKLDALAENLKARDVFLSTVSHELRSPLQSILSSLEMLQMRSGRVDTVTLGRLRRSVVVLSTQMTDLLTLARGKAGELKISPAVTTVEEIFVGIDHHASVLAQEKQVAIRIDIPFEPREIVVDAVRVSQIAENLIANAVKYTDAGTVSFSALPLDLERGLLTFTVEDTGVGIPKDAQQAIFEPYVRAGGHGYEKESAGVGLSVVRTLLSSLGGTLTLESEVGVGSLFRIQIPVSVPAFGRPNVRGEQILMIDDRQDVLEGLVAVAAEIGYQVDKAVSVGQARNHLAACRYQTIFIDLEMPVVSGLDLAREIRDPQSFNCRARLVAMTASEIDASGTDWPFDALVRKPISATQLRAVLTLQSRAENIDQA